MKHRAAFTLVELLVVLTIITILIACILPSLKEAKIQAYDIKCMSGLRQLAVVNEAYMGDSGGVFAAHGYASTGDAFYDRFVKNGYAGRGLFVNSGGCPYTTQSRYHTNNNHDVFYGHANPTKHTAYAVNEAMVGSIDYTTKNWSISDWNGVSYSASGFTNVKPERYKRFRKWPTDILMYHCSTVSESSNYGFHGLNLLYTMGVGGFGYLWVTEPNLSLYRRHEGRAIPSLFYDGHLEKVTEKLWRTDQTREIRWKSMAAFNKTEYQNSGAYRNPEQ